MTLEDSEKKKASESAAADGEESGAPQSEDEVLESGVEAMKRTSAEPSLDETTSSGGEASAHAAAQAGGGSAGSPDDGTESGGGSSGGSEAERLNAELNASLGRFDGAMLGERDRVQASAENTGSGASQAESAAMLDPDAGEDADAAGNYGSVREGPAPQQEGGGNGGEEGRGARAGGGAVTEEDASSGSGMSTIGGGKGRKGDYTHTASANTPPPDIPDGSDDDVVARQIREAAMKEKDPELRDKLWDEYRKYVNASKRKS